MQCNQRKQNIHVMVMTGIVFAAGVPAVAQVEGPLLYPEVPQWTMSTVGLGLDMTTAEINAARSRVEALATPRRSESARAAQYLVHNCPYRAATLDLVDVLHTLLATSGDMSIGCPAADPEKYESTVRERLRTTALNSTEREELVRLLSEVRRGQAALFEAVDAQWRLLGALGATRGRTPFAATVAEQSVESPECRARLVGTSTACRDGGLSSTLIAIQALESKLSGVNQAAGMLDAATRERLDAAEQVVAGAGEDALNGIKKYMLSTYGFELGRLAEKTMQVIQFCDDVERPDAVYGIHDNHVRLLYELIAMLNAFRTYMGLRC